MCSLRWSPGRECGSSHLKRGVYSQWGKLLCGGAHLMSLVVETPWSKVSWGQAHLESMVWAPDFALGFAEATHSSYWYSSSWRQMKIYSPSLSALPSANWSSWFTVNKSAVLWFTADRFPRGCNIFVSEAFYRVGYLCPGGSHPVLLAEFIGKSGPACRHQMGRNPALGSLENLAPCISKRSLFIFSRAATCCRPTRTQKQFSPRKKEPKKYRQL